MRDKSTLSFNPCTWMSSMERTTYEFDQWKRKMGIKWIPLDPIPSKKNELHHLLGRKFSDLVLQLPANWHSFISSRQDTIPRAEKRNLLFFALMSVAALLQLAVELLLWICFTLREENISENWKNKEGKP